MLGTEYCEHRIKEQKTEHKCKMQVKQNEQKESKKKKKENIKKNA